MYIGSHALDIGISNIRSEALENCGELLVPIEKSNQVK
jgi:hypothetical protein